MEALGTQLIAILAFILARTNNGIIAAIPTLGALALGALAFWIWFVRNMLSAGRRRLAELEAEVDALSVAAVPAQPLRRREQARGQAQAPGAAGAAAVAAELQRRLVRDAASRAPVADVEGVLVADIAANGGMTVSGAPDLSAALRSPAPAPRPAALPSGSLFRLQARHRGGKGRAGARALDRATHPVLKTLAARIRPVVSAAPGAQRAQPPPPQSLQTASRPRGRATERYVRQGDF